MDKFKEKLKVWSKKWWFWVVAVIVFFLIILPFFTGVFMGIAKVVTGNYTYSDKVNTINQNSTIENLQQQISNLTNEIQDKNRAINETANEVRKLQDENTELKNKINDTAKNEETTQPTASEPVAEQPAQEESSSEPTERTYTYILNTNTHVFHRQGCSSVSKLKDKNKSEYEGTRSEVINKGYKPCERCNP